MSSSGMTDSASSSDSEPSPAVNIMDDIDLTKDLIGKELYALCRALGVNELEYEQFKAKFESKIKQTYPTFAELEDSLPKPTLPLSYEQYDLYYSYWKPYFLLQAMSLMSVEHYEPPENMVSVVKSVQVLHRDVAVVFRCTIAKQIDEMIHFSHCLVTLTEEQLKDKDCFPNRQYGRTLLVKNIKNIIAKDPQFDPVHADLFDFGEIIVLLPRCEYTENLQIGQILYMNIITKYFGLSRQEKNLRRLEYNRFFKEHFLNPKIDKINLFPEGYVGKLNETLNIYQNLAVQTVLKYVGSKDAGILQILGPPGSGKTHTIVATLVEVFKNNPKARVLVCTPSNAAVNIIARRVVDNKLIFDEPAAFQGCGPIFRLGIFKKIDPKLQCFNPTTPSDYRRLQKKRTLIFSTLNSCQPLSLDHCIDKISFDLVIIDESCQCAEPETLMAMQYKSPLFMLVGDHKQLQPTIHSQMCVNFGYNRSFFERLQTLKEIHNNTTTIGLWFQYRMREEICGFPSGQFYKGALETVLHSGLNNNILLPPVTAFNLMDTDEERFNTSVRNTKEGDFIVKMLNDILHKRVRPGVPLSIGIICFYKAQAEYIEMLLQEPFYAGFDIQVDTVDAFQGREKDIIIVSCSRSNMRKTIGFSESPNRMNVALTRAKTALIIVLDQSTFQREPLWQNLFFCYSQWNRLFAVKSTMFNSPYGPFDGYFQSNTLRSFPFSFSC